MGARHSAGALLIAYHGGSGAVSLAHSRLAALIPADLSQYKFERISRICFRSYFHVMNCAICFSQFNINWLLP